MKFNQELAGKLSKDSCRKCWGRGYVVAQHSFGSPIINQKEKDGVVIIAGSPIGTYVNYCECVDKKINKMKKIMEKAKKAKKAKEEKDKQEKMSSTNG